MAPSSRDRISVDLRGLKSVLFEHARAARVSPSDFVRAALEAALSASSSASTAFPQIEDSACSTLVRLSMRVRPEEAQSIREAARRMGLPLGTYVAELAAGVPVLQSGSVRQEHLAALIASSSELSTLSRNIHHLTALLRQGSIRAAQEYREMLDTLTKDVRGHLSIASAALAELRPRRASGVPQRKAAKQSQG